MASRVLLLKVDLDQLQRITTIGAIVSWALAGIFAAGELLGWWRDAGEFGIVVSVLTAMLLTLVTLLLSATKGQARAIVVGVREGNRMHQATNEKLDQTNRMHEATNEKLDQTNRMHEETHRILREIRDRLPG